MFKKLLVLLSMLAALAMSAVAFAAPAKSHQQMVIDAARAEVPAAAVFYGYKEEDGEAVLNFRDNDNYLEYEVEVVLATTKVKEVEIKGSNIAGSTMMVKTPEDIRQIVLEAYPDARNIVIKTEKEGNNVHYDVEFVTARYKVDADMNPVHLPRESWNISKLKSKIRGSLRTVSFLCCGKALFASKHCISKHIIVKYIRYRVFNALNIYDEERFT